MEAYLTPQQNNARIRLGFGALLGLFVVAATLSMVGLLRLEAADEDFTQRVSVVALARGLDRDFHDLRRSVGDFTSTGRQDAVDRAMKMGAIIRTTVAEALPEIHDPQRRKRMAEVSRGFETYMTAFSALVEGRNIAATGDLLSGAARSVEENVIWIRDSGAGE